MSRSFGKDYEWANTLWCHCETLAAKLPGKVVMQALAKASDKMYGAGIDDVFWAYNRRKQHLSNIAVAGRDICWLTAFSIELTKRVAKRRKGK